MLLRNVGYTLWCKKNHESNITLENQTKLLPLSHLILSITFVIPAIFFNDSSIFHTVLILGICYYVAILYYLFQLFNRRVYSNLFFILFLPFYALWAILSYTPLTPHLLAAS